MENIGICLPQPGYLQAVREITRKYGTMLIFDEVKTGITAGWGGATGVLGVQPDLVALAKSIGGGLPLGAFGGTQECMDQITAGKVLHLGTYNGNPLCMAAAKAVLDRDLHPRGHRRGDRPATAVLVAACQGTIDAAGLPAHTVQFGAKGCVTWAREPIQNYRDYKATDFDLAFAQWMHGINRGVLLPPGLDEQWLISVMHTEADAHALRRRVRASSSTNWLADRRQPSLLAGTHRRMPPVRSSTVAPTRIARRGQRGETHDRVRR